MDNTPKELPLEYGAPLSSSLHHQELLTKHQLKKRHPKGDYQIIGEYPPVRRGHTGATSDAGQIPLCRYRSHNRLVFAAKGFLPCGEEGSYAAVLCNRLPLRLSAVGLCALLAVLAAVWFSASPMLPAGLGLPIDPNATDYSQSDGYNQGGSAGDSIEIPGYKSIPIAADSTRVAVDFRNPADNPCYFVIRLTLEDGTELYRSDLIPPGKGIESITLSKPLPEGEYAAFVQYETYSIEDQTPLNGANVKIKLLAQTGL